MKLVRKVLGRLNGLHYPQEYLCFAKESLQQLLRIYLVSGNRIIADITNHHLFIGYCPVIFALHSLRETDLSQLPAIKILFSTKTLRTDDIIRDKDAVAMLELKKIRQQDKSNESIFYYEAVTGKHRFISAFHQFIMGLDNRLFNKKPGNVFLSHNMYKQVQAAYSFPRLISLITVGQDHLFNLFPTDLNGEAGDNYFIISLRHGGKACRQTEATRRILISQIDAQAYKEVYSLGKNHMQELRTKDHFPFSRSLSPLLQLPVPESALTCYELDLEDSFIHGIHKLMLFKILSKNDLVNQKSTLAHIHNSYATWRYNNHLEGNYLLR